MEYGRATLDRVTHHWDIECDPEISPKLQKAFRKDGEHGIGRHTLHDTPEVARKLYLFALENPIRYEVNDLFLRMKADPRRARDAIVAAPPILDCSSMAISPREYQQQAASLLLARKGLLLADQCGLGKTGSAITTFTDPRARPAIVVTLPHLCAQWAHEINRFIPSLSVHIVSGSIPYDVLPPPDVYIISYSKLSTGWVEKLGHFCQSIVFDEAQELRRKKSRKYKCAKALADKMTYRLGLSATPIYNMGAEISNVMACLCPDALDGDFREEWCGRGDEVVQPEVLGDYLRTEGLMLRRTRADVGRELPAVQICPRYVEIDPAPLAAVAQSCAALAEIVLQGGPEVFRGQRMRAAEELSSSLRQATGMAKAASVAAFVRRLVAEGEPVVLFGWHRAVYDSWLRELADLHPVLYTGSESAAEKAEAKRSFLAGESNVLIISLRAGAGLDGLQGHCKTVVFGELDWAAGAMAQCLGRVYRDGQAEHVSAYYLLAEEGVDPTMVETLDLKADQFDSICAPDEITERLYTPGEQMRRLAADYLNT